MAVYDAFISYSHAKDKPIAAALQSIVQSLGKPWYRRRALRIFRDDTSLSATPSLWPSIEQALAQSRYLILMASPEAAASHWVNKEVAYWLDHKSADTLLIALTDGDLAWDRAAGDFARGGAVPLPPALTGRLTSEPKWIDLRPYRDGADPRDSRFVEAGADFAAAIHGMPKEDLLSEEVRQQRGRLRLAWSAVGVLAGLMVFAGWQWWEADSAKRVAVAAEGVANEQKGIAQKQRDLAERNFGIAQKASDDMLLGLAQELRRAENMSLRSRRVLLDTAQQLMDRLVEASPSDLSVQRSRAIMLHEFAQTYLAGGDLVAASEVADEMLRLTRKLFEADPDNRFGLGGRAPDLRRASVRRLDLSMGLNLIADVRLAAGDRVAARAAADEALAIGRELLAGDPDNLDLQSTLATQLGRAGLVRLIAGDIAGAEVLYDENLAISRKLVDARPKDVDYQSGLAIALHKVGEVRADRGDRAGALAAFEESLFITRQLVKFDPGNSRWQSDVGQALARIGGLRAQEGDRPAALAAYQEGLAIYRRLAGRDASNSQWQKYMSQLIALVGDIQFDDDRKAALAAYDEAIAIMRKLAAADPGNTEWQHDLSARLDRVGQARMAEDDFAGALAAYVEGVALMRKLVESDRGNIIWQRDLNTTLGKVGNARLALKDRAGALAAYEEAVKVMRSLAAAAPGHAGWQERLGANLEKVGDVRSDAGDTSGALVAYEESLSIRRNLAVADPKDVGRQVNLALGLYNVSTVVDSARRRALLSEALTIAERLAQDGTLPTEHQDWPRLFRELLATSLPERAGTR